MTDDYSNDGDDKLGFEENLKSISEKYGIEMGALEELTEEDLNYLIYRCPFLQIVNTQARFDGLYPEVQMVQSDSGLTIMNYGDAMSSALGMYLFSSGDSKLLTKDGGEREVGGKGTFINQAFVTATQMVEMAKQEGWSGIKFVDGHEVMVRAAWIKSQHLGLGVEGFSPTEKDMRAAKRVTMSSGEMEVLRSRVTTGLN